MIVLVHHQGKRVLRVYRNGKPVSCINKVPSLALFEVAENHPDELLVWCEEPFEKGIEELNWHKIIKNRLVLASFSCSGRVFLPESIGFVDHAPFAKINRNVKYPTWIMSGDRGGVYAKTLLAFKDAAIPVTPFDNFLSAIAKQGMPHGMLCYSAPNIADGLPNREIKFSTDYGLLYAFVKANYKSRWLLLLFIQQLIYQEKTPIFSFINAVFKPKNASFTPIFPVFRDKVIQTNHSNIGFDLDVLIPTIGRKVFLYDVLKDLRLQTLLPQKVIIIEQNPDPDSNSELDYVTKEQWPFEIKHIFTHETGACKARNLGLDKVTSEWVFFADDDIGIPEDFLAAAYAFTETNKVEAFTVSCLKENEQESIPQVVQWRTFGSGCSFVKAGCLENIQFDLSYEGGFGEDADFGMQLRNKGVDILYNPFLKLIHLKAPVGGFRYKVSQPWEEENIQPKPNPTVMVYQLKHANNYQLKGFKTLLILKFFRRQADKNPFTYFRSMQKRWESSKKWARILLKR